MFSVNLSSVQEQQLSNIVPEDSAFSTDEGTDNTYSDIQSDLLTGDSGIPVSPADSVPFPVSPEMVPPLVLDETADEASLPPWLEAVSYFKTVIRVNRSGNLETTNPTDNNNRS